jgi:lipoprotein-anchoring transpeptidase ErfK/SrfK
MQMKTLALAVGLALATAVSGCSTFGPYKVFSSDYGSRTDAGYRLPSVPIYKVPKKFHRQIVAYDGGEKPGTIIVDTGEKHLYFVLPGGEAVRYGIGVGREGFTWSGVQAISRKSEWPDWIPPADMLQRQPYLPRFMAGGPGNPLGARAMYLGSSIYRIHGTNQPSTIGGRVSSGCIRMLNDDVVDLYNRVNIGTKVVVLPMGERRTPVAETTGRATPDAVSSANTRAVPANTSIFGTLRGVY